MAQRHPSYREANQHHHHPNEGYVNVGVGRQNANAATGISSPGSSVASCSHEYVNDAVFADPAVTPKRRVPPPPPPRSPATTRQTSVGGGGVRTFSESEGFSTDNDDTWTECEHAPRPIGAYRRSSSNHSSSQQLLEHLVIGEDSTSTAHTVKMRVRPLRAPRELVTANYEYTGTRDDELTLKRGSVIEVISKDSEICGGDGWWAGKLDDKVGVFPANFVQTDANAIINVLNHVGLDRGEPLEIPFSDLELWGDPIGAGGFGKVYKAEWKPRGEIVAVKAAKYDTGDNLMDITENVRKEGKLFSLMSHENIVGFYGLCLESPNFCLVLEYCAGGTLNKLFQEYNIPPPVLIDWAVQIAKGMQYLHEEAEVCLVHRDLKSSNVLIKEPVFENNQLIITTFANLTLKITDFGLAREATHTTRMTVCGTYAWMAPEVIKSSTFSKASDVWSFGVLLWELLTGETPYKGIDYLAVAYGVATAKLKLPIPESCPDELRVIMSACWALEPHQRPTFGALLKDLQMLLDGWQHNMIDDNFDTIQRGWRDEIEIMFCQMKELESDLRAKEGELRDREQKLREREQHIRDRELDLVGRELEMKLQEVPVAATRRGRFKLKKNLRMKKRELISAPKDFRHNITVRPSSESPPNSPTHSSARPGNLRVFTDMPGSSTPTDDDDLSNTPTQTTSKPAAFPGVVGAVGSSSVLLAANALRLGQNANKTSGTQPSNEIELPRKASEGTALFSTRTLDRITSKWAKTKIATPSTNSTKPPAKTDKKYSSTPDLAKYCVNLKMPLVYPVMNEKMSGTTTGNTDKSPVTRPTILTNGAHKTTITAALPSSTANVKRSKKSSLLHQNSQSDPYLLDGGSSSETTTLRDDDSSTLCGSDTYKRHITDFQSDVEAASVDLVPSSLPSSSNRKPSLGTPFGFGSSGGSGSTGSSARSTPRKSAWSPGAALSHSALTAPFHSNTHKPIVSQVLCSAGNVLAGVVTRREMTNLSRMHMERDGHSSLSPSAEFTTGGPLRSSKRGEGFFHAFQASSHSPSLTSPFRRAAKGRHSGSSIQQTPVNSTSHTPTVRPAHQHGQLRPCQTFDETHDDGVYSYRSMPRQTQSSQTLNLRSGSTPQSPPTTGPVSGPALQFPAHQIVPITASADARLRPAFVPQPTSKTRFNYLKKCTSSKRRYYRNKYFGSYVRTPQPTDGGHGASVHHPHHQHHHPHHHGSSSQTRNSRSQQSQQQTQSPPVTSVAQHQRAKFMNAGHRTRSCDEQPLQPSPRSTRLPPPHDLNVVVPPPINPLTGTVHQITAGGSAKPLSVWNPGYESCVLPSAQGGSTTPGSPPPERPRTLALNADPPTPAESGICTAGSSLVSFPPSADALQSTTRNLLDVHSVAQTLDRTPPLPPRSAAGTLSPVVHSPPDYAQ